MTRRPIFLAILVLLAMGAVYTAWWLHLAGLVRQQVEAWAGAERARAGLVEYRDLDIGGFPFRIAADARDIRIVRPDGTVWRGKAATAWARPWNPGDIDVVLSGTHALRLPAATSGADPGAEAGVALEAMGGTGRISLDGGRFASGRLGLHDVVLSLPGREGARFRATGLNGTLGPPAGPAGTRVAIEVAGLALPDGLEAPLGRMIEAATVEAVIEGPLPGRADPAAILAWAERGGALRLDAVGVRWGPLHLAAEGRIAFDAATRPSGSLQAQAEGIEPALDALAATGALPDRDAAMAKAALGLLAQRRTPEGAPIVDASLTLQDGWLYFGPMRLLAVPPLDALLAGLRPASPR